MLQFMGLERVGHDLVTEQQQQNWALEISPPRREKSELTAYCGMGEHHVTKLWQYLEWNKVKPEVTKKWKFGLRLPFHHGDLARIE